jgi:hypothetical protein
MRLEARKVLTRLVLLLGTTVSILCYNYTRLPIFVALPFMCGVAMIVLIRRTPIRTAEELRVGRRARRNALAQLSISCTVLLVLIIVSWSRHWGVAAVAGFIIMELTLISLALMAYLFYRRGGVKIRASEIPGLEAPEREGSDDGGV